ncbi:class I SAM-dependent methyltransferase [Sphingobacterium suaedae]|uniref:THUMP-like domain-containing protein n=1 Tax=Sphingobacterium suaedae TaxID=1686402 RepID=A0ABW5KDR4_9SPHI
MNKDLLTTDVQSYIHANQHSNPAAIALQKSPFETVTARELAAQIDGMQRVKKKIPAWLEHTGLYFPEKLNLEQASSSATGAFKSSLIAKDSRVIDLTGGFGVDSYYFAQHARQVTHCEINEDLSQIVAHNFKVLHVSHVDCIAGDGLELLRSQETSYDMIYIDPSRRVKQQKVFCLEDCEPNILESQDLFFSRAPYILTKLAPLLDIQLALRSLAQVKDVYVVSVDNDCKELLFMQERNYLGSPQIHAVRLLPDGPHLFSFNYTEEQDTVALYSAPKKYLYDPDVAVNKAGAFKSVGTRYGLGKLAAHTHLYTGDTDVTDFPGKQLKIIDTYTLKSLKKALPLKKANVISKNFPLRVEEIRKKFKIDDGGNDYLYFCTLERGEHVVIHGIRCA